MPTESAQYFVGEFRHKLDAKNRLTIPSDWRFSADDARSVYLAIPDPSGCISVLPPEKVAQLLEAASQSTLSAPEKQRALTMLARISCKVVCDKAGRISLDARLLAHAGISGDAVLVGAFKKFNIWNPERFDAEMAKMGSAEDVFRTLGELGL
ncbi:division/cell wall cluster transcriptional repressor MraZ [Candidatus Spyradosoma sp. SGI.093]|uniref:division/cell wall cluster transcriptional repressor MraZ n=1 Tax=Candidatus Spyradosoma sp. SGI.093 TaxID=3420583 RepID=UPI003D04DBA9